MNAMEAITAMLSAFPQTQGDHKALFRIYVADTAHIAPEHVVATAARFRQGRVPKQSKQFAPTPAQFIEEAEEAEKLERLRNRIPIAPPKAVQRGGYFQRLQAKRDEYRAFSIIQEGVGHDLYQKLLQRKALPNPHFWVAHTGVIYAGLHPKLAGRPASKPHSEVA
jgi:hypothetical protein